MKVSPVAKTLWTPQGEVTTQEKDVTPITRDEVITLSKMHEIAFRHGMSLVCKRCDHAFTGQNNDQSRVLSISCQCRQLLFDGR
jgi:hypothetical protein